MSIVSWAPGPDPGTVLYLPTAPSPQLDPAGRPAVSLMTAGTSAFLQLAAQWDPPAAALELLREKFDHPVALTPPALEMGQATLLADDRPLQSVTTSGFPPYAALFAAALDADARSAATAALHGEPGRLTVRFEARLDGKPLVREADVAAWLGDREPTLVATEAIADLRRFDDPTVQPPRSTQC